MVLPFSRLNSVEYFNKPDNAWKDYYYAQAFPEESSLQRGGNVPFYRGPVLQRGYNGLGSIFKSVARSVMPSLKEIGKSALTILVWKYYKMWQRARISRQRQRNALKKTV